MHLPTQDGGSEKYDPPSTPGSAVAGFARADLVVGIVWYGVATLLVATGVLFGANYLSPVEPGATAGGADPVASCVRFDGGHYRDVAQRGYDYDPETRSMVAFFPAYPLTVRFVSAVTGLRTEAALLAVSNACLASAFILMASYSRLRAGAGRAGRVGFTLLAFAVWPSTFFFHLAYAESMFLAASLVTLIGIHCRWPLLWNAFAAGLATATRPVGVAVAAAFLWHVVRGSERSLRSRVVLAVGLAPIACWGILDYVAFQTVAFGQPLAFARTQEHWAHCPPVARPTLSQKAIALATLEPILGVFDAESPRYWGAPPNSRYGAPFNLFLWNPVLFVASGALVAWGACRGWLTGPEVVLGVLLLAIPYVTRSYEMSMASHARFAAAVVVVYPVIGRLLAATPPPAVAAVAAGSGVLLVCWTALYVTGHLLY